MLIAHHVLQAAQRVFEETVKQEHPFSFIQNDKGEIVESGFITLPQVKGAMHSQKERNKRCLFQQVCCLIGLTLRMFGKTVRQEAVTGCPLRLGPACRQRRERAL